MRDFKRLTENTFPELVAEHQANLEPCPNNITDVILRILQTGVLEARSAGWSKDADLGAAQADHIHNLPDLLRRYSPRKLKHYWSIERPAFIRRLGGQPLAFEEFWAELEPLVPQS